jgi:aspartyl-tRNA(Asn)/glutamyl-tRNA(Gln) amidotransferase subunit A
MSSLPSILDASEHIRRGEVSAIALADSALERIDRLNPSLNAFITVTHELARSQAAAADSEFRAGRVRGALHGLPVAVKDFYDTAGIRTTAGFVHFAQRVPTRNAALVNRLNDAGAVLVGKTNMHRLGSGTTSLDSDFGPVVNPRDARRVAGGSSGGSAVAVATGMCFGTVDTDAVGSGRLPAAICGVSCFKPTYGVLDASGILADQPAPDPTILLLSHPCVMARTAEDAAVMFATLADRPLAETALVRRLGVVTNYSGTPEIRSAFDRCLASLRSIALELVETTAPFEAARFDAAAIERARLGELAVSPNNTFFCNYFGYPAISVPAGFLTDDLPFGIQFVGPTGADDRVLSLAQAFHRVLGQFPTKGSDPF